MTFYILLPVLLCVFVFKPALGSQGVTIDDRFGDELTGAKPSYSPIEAWQQSSCSQCTLAPDTNKTIQGSYHFVSSEAADELPSVSFTFSGTAVHIYGIVQSNMLTNVDIFVDGNTTQPFSWVPEDTDGEAIFLYDTPMFSIPSLILGEHTINMIVSPLDNNASVFFFDYAVYQTDISPGIGSNSPTATISSTSTVPSKSSIGSSTTRSPVRVSSSSTSSVVSTGPSTSATSTVVSVTSSSPSISSTSLSLEFSSSLLATNTPPSLASLPSEATSTMAHSTSVASTGSGVTHANSIASNRRHVTSQRHLVIIVVSSIGGVSALALLLIIFLCCRRRHRIPKFAVEPFVIEAVPRNSGYYHEKSPTFTTLTDLDPALGRLSHLTISSGTISPVPTEDSHVQTEVEHVHRQLELLTTQVGDLHIREKAAQAGIGSSSLVRPVRVQSAIATLRAEVERMRYRRADSLNAPSQPLHTDATPLGMLSDLAVIRVEIDEMLMQRAQAGMVDSDVERLPSYHSRRTIAGRGVVEEPPPPLPQECTP